MNTVTYRRTNLQTGETYTRTTETDHSAKAFARALESWNKQQPETWHYAMVTHSELRFPASKAGFLHGLGYSARQGGKD